MPIKFNYFTVINESNFDNKMIELRKVYSRIDDVYETLSWTLGKTQEIGIVFDDENNHRICKTDSIGATPSFWVIFRVDKLAGIVYLVSLAPVKEDEE